jgi:hypothetical protein
MATTKAVKKARLRARITSALLRATRTFIQAFLATFTLSVVAPGGVIDVSTVEKVGASAVVAGLAAVFALVQRWLDTVDAIPTIPPG